MTDPPKPRITIRSRRMGRTTAWVVSCSRCVDLRALCHKKATAEALATGHSRESHQQRAVIATAIR